MKKVLYILAIAVVTSVAFSACTEEVVTPKTESTGAGSGTGTDPIKP
jgi:hypothetical protein